VTVLEYQQHRPAATDVGKQVGYRRVEAVALGVGIGLDRRRKLADQSGQSGQQPRQLAAARAERGSQLLGLNHPCQAIERLDEGPERRPHHGVAGAIENKHPFRCRLAGELARQATLPDTRLARQKGHPAALAVGSRHQGLELLQLALAADKRGSRGRAKRVRKLPDLSVHGRTIVSPDHPDLKSIDRGRSKLGQVRS
jgi:hypothetical protein